MRYILVLLLLLSSCTKKESAEDVLSDFIKYRFNKNQSREMLLERTTGALFQKIREMDEETLTQFVYNDDLKLRKYKVNLSRCSDETCFITYTLAYDQSDEKGRAYETVIKKIAEVQKEDEMWKISDVSNVKTYIDSKRPINTGNQK
ncbi:MAG: hypothetical protein HN576_16805 [Bacteriovoracaceae bacterium]|jgi:hypothetical protein|nr:hypothetical protein [Bacteriovoracaceae bacterium]